jgi:FtsP/CotA-like multicopper oxidase with cupredoxin domain
VTAVVATAGVGLALLPADPFDTGGGPAPVAATGHVAADHAGAVHQVAGPGQGGAGHMGEGAGVGGQGGSTPVTALTGPATPAPGGVVRRYELTARKATVTLASGRRVEAWTYNGQVPGPAITARQGDLIEVTLRNADIGIGVTLHWHGYDVPAAEDGAPGLTQAAVMPGQTFTYRFRADQAGTFWYHTHQVSHEGVRMGLYGTLVVAPRAEEAPATGLDLTLPAHTLKGTVILGDHDRPVAREAKPGAPVRLRLINTDSTPHRFTLDGTPYRLVAVDGRDLSGPGELPSSALLLPAGGRFGLALARPQGPVTLLMDGARTGGVRLLPGTAAAVGAAGVAGRDKGSTPDVEAAAGRVPVRDTSAWPELDLNGYGTPAPLPITLGGRFDRRFTLVLDRGLAMVEGAPRYAQTVNGLGFPNIPSEVVRENDLVLLTIVNRSLEIHPWHLHGHAVLVLSRDGVAPSGSPMWRDTFDVLPGQVWQVAFRATNRGLWMNHCHNLPHAAQGMALHLLYEGVTTPFHGGHGG